MLTRLSTVLKTEWVDIIAQVLRWLIAGAMGGVIALNIGNEFAMFGATIGLLAIGILSEALIRALVRERDAQRAASVDA